jgi:hypothetical protein
MARKNTAARLAARLKKLKAKVERKERIEKMRKEIEALQKRLGK